MIIINGIYNDYLENKSEKYIIYYWYEKIDNLYYNNTDDIIIHLNNKDKKIIKLIPDCYDKLKILSFKKNVEIDNF